MASTAGAIASRTEVATDMFSVQAVSKQAYEHMNLNIQVFSKALNLVRMMERTKHIQKANVIGTKTGSLLAMVNQGLQSTARMSLFQAVKAKHSLRGNLPPQLLQCTDKHSMQGQCQYPSTSCWLAYLCDPEWMPGSTHKLWRSWWKCHRSAALVAFW